MYEIILMYICTYVRLVCHKLMDYSQQRDIEQTDGRTHVCIYLKMCVYLLLYCRCCCCCRRHRYWRSRSFCYCFYSLLCLASSPSKRPTDQLSPVFNITSKILWRLHLVLCVYVCLSVFIQTNGIYIRMYVCVPSLPLPFVGVVAVFAPLIAHFVLKFACFFWWLNEHLLNDFLFAFKYSHIFAIVCVRVCACLLGYENYFVWMLYLLWAFLSLSLIVILNEYICCSLSL